MGSYKEIKYKALTLINKVHSRYLIRMVYLNEKFVIYVVYALL